jgi:hypothetical protein
MEPKDFEGVNDETRRQAELRMIAGEDQWTAQWGPQAKPPRHSPDIRPLVWEIDRTLRQAAQYLELGVVLSPESVQILKNALLTFEAGQALDRGEMTAEEYNAYVRWQNDEPPTE